MRSCAIFSAARAKSGGEFSSPIFAAEADQQQNAAPDARDGFAADGDFGARHALQQDFHAASAVSGIS